MPCAPKGDVSLPILPILDDSVGQHELGPFSSCAPEYSKRHYQYRILAIRLSVAHLDEQTLARAASLQALLVGDLYLNMCLGHGESSQAT